MRSSESGSVLSSTKSQTRQRRVAVTNVVDRGVSLERTIKCCTDPCLSAQESDTGGRACQLNRSVRLPLRRHHYHSLPSRSIQSQCLTAQASVLKRSSIFGPEIESQRLWR